MWKSFVFDLHGGSAKLVARKAGHEMTGRDSMFGNLINSTAAIARNRFFGAFWSPRSSRRSIDVD
jgi:hypothetical protein